MIISPRSSPLARSARRARVSYEWVPRGSDPLQKGAHRLARTAYRRYASREVRHKQKRLFEVNPQPNSEAGP